MEFSAKQIAELIQGSVEGNENTTVHTFAKIEEGQTGAISFLSNPKYTHYLYETKSSIVIVNNDLTLEKPVSATLIRVPNAYESVAQLLQFYESMKPRKTGIDLLASVAATAKIGENCYVGPLACIGEGAEIAEGTQIYPHAVIGDGVKVGSNAVIYPNVTVYQGCRIGNNVTIHAGAVIGSDGFGFAPNSEGYDKIPQIGIVVIEDNVEIGANTCIDRSTMGATVVHKGVKLDNLIQVAHNVEIGSNTVMAAQCGIAGSTKIGQWCMFGGQVGMAGHIAITDRTTVGAQAGITNSIKTSGQTIIGSPAWDAKGFMKSAAVFRHLPEMFQQIKDLQRQIEKLSAELQQRS